MTAAADNLRRTRNEPPETVDVAIVGAGLAGLYCGAELATHGLRVALFDPHYVAGGCTTQFGRKVGGKSFAFDVGLHYIGEAGPDGIIARLFRHVGAEVAFRELDPDGFDILRFPDFELRVPASLEAYRERLLALFPRERRGIDRYLRLVREVKAVGATMHDRGERPTARMLFTIALHGRFVAANQGTTLAELLDGCTTDPRLRAVLAAQHGDYALPPSEVSAVFHAGLCAHYFGGAYYPEGGGQAPSDALARRIEAHGGVVCLKRPVARILVTDGCATGVVTEGRRPATGETVRARAVVSAADLRRTLLELVGPEHLARRWRRRAEGFEMAGALFMTYLGIERDMAAAGMRNANYWQYDDYDIEGAYRKMRTSEKIDVRGCYVTSASLKDPASRAHAPAGVANVEVMALVDGEPRKWGAEAGNGFDWSYKHGERYRAIKHEVEEGLVLRLEALFPGSRERIVYRESATPLTHGRFTRATGLTGYGIAATPEQSLDRRPGHRGPCERLFLCGASTRPGHGILGALLSGHQAARELLGELGVATRRVPR